MAFQYGMMHSLQKAAVKVGALECTGLYKPNPKTCEAVKVQGGSSGVYIMDRHYTVPNSSISLERCHTMPACTSDNVMIVLSFRIDVVKCNIKEKGTTEELVTHLTKSMNVTAYIFGKRTYSDGDVIGIDTLLVNDFNAFEMENSTFTAPFAGSYSITTHTYSPNYCRHSCFIEIRGVTNGDSLRISSYPNGSWRADRNTLNLNQGDQYQIVANGQFSLEGSYSAPIIITFAAGLRL